MEFYLLNHKTIILQIVYKMEKIMEIEQFAEYRIEGLKLSNRTYNSLKKNGINTIQDVFLCTEDKIKSMKNIGNKSIEEICEIKSQLIKGSINLHEDVIVPDFFMPDEISVCQWIFGKKFDENIFNMKNVEGLLVDDIQICNMKLSIRSQRCLYSVHVKTLRNLLVMKKKDFLELRNLGQKSINEIIESMQRHVIVNSYAKTTNKNYDEFANFIQNDYREVGIELSKFIINASIEDLIKEEDILTNNEIELYYQNEFIQRLYVCLFVKEYVIL